VSSSFYNDVYRECRNYFGSQTKQFLDQQILINLLKTPAMISHADKSELAKYIWIASALIIGKEKAKVLADRILNLRQ